MFMYICRGGRCHTHMGVGQVLWLSIDVVEVPKQL